MAKNYRQGDVLLFGVDKSKYSRRYSKGWQKKFRLKKNGVIIEGEVTGHFHEVQNGKLYEDPKNKDKMILEAESGCVVVHPEHGPIKMPKGIYEIDIQREYDGKDARKVKD
jgi:hypothetical protein